MCGFVPQFNCRLNRSTVAKSMLSYSQQWAHGSIICERLRRTPPWASDGAIQFAPFIQDWLQRCRHILLSRIESLLLFFFFRSVRIESGGKRSVWSRIGNVDLVFLYINTRIRSFRWESNFWASTQFGVCLSKARYNSNFGVMSMQSLSLCGGIWMNWMRHMKQWMTRAMIYTKLSYIYFYGKANSSIQNGDTSTS